MTAAPPLEVLCPLCRLAPDAETLRCPDCKESLAPLVRLKHAGRIDYNEALKLVRDGRDFAALVLLRRAVAAEPELWPAWELMTEVAARVGADADADGAMAASVLQRLTAAD